MEYNAMKSCQTARLPSQVGSLAVIPELWMKCMYFNMETRMPLKPSLLIR